MKNYRITVNGNTYDVAVEDITGASQEAPSVQTVQKSAPTAPAPAKQAASAAGGKKIEAPMPGNVFDIKVKVGDKVKKDQVVLVLEAMKMENEIVTPFAGTVASVNVSKGASVNSGDILITVTE